MTSAKTKHDALLDALLKEYTDPTDILGEHGLLKPLTKRVVERALDAELTAHLGYAPHRRHGSAEGNARHGTSHKTVQTDTGPLPLAVPRERQGRCVPRLVPKRQRRLAGFDEKGLSLYARGLSTRDIQGHLEELYGTEVSPTLISSITDAVLDEGRTWQARPLAAVYPILYCDALFVKSRQEGAVQTKAVYLALGVTMAGEKALLGLWLSESEGGKFWLSVFTDVHNRGVQDCFIACVDGLTGLPEAIEAVFPKTQVQLCIVHKVRNSLKYVPWKERKAVATDLRAIYGAATLAEAELALEHFADRWDAHYPAISPSWLADWEVLSHLTVPQDEMRQDGKDGFARQALHPPDGEPTQPDTGIMGVARQAAPLGAVGLVEELKAKGEEESDHELHKRLAIAKELKVGRFILKIHRNGPVDAGLADGVSHGSSSGQRVNAADDPPCKNTYVISRRSQRTTVPHH